MHANTLDVRSGEKTGGVEENSSRARKFALPRSFQDLNPLVADRGASNREGPDMELRQALPATDAVERKIPLRGRHRCGVAIKIATSSTFQPLEPGSSSSSRDQPTNRPSTSLLPSNCGASPATEYLACMARSAPASSSHHSTARSSTTSVRCCRRGPTGSPLRRARVSAPVDGCLIASSWHLSVGL